jgi:glycosyltransferase involved in cell wall biosynthesis
MKFSPKITQLLGDFDPSAPPPKIDPVPNGVNRPRWSVMIPTFNCAEYLKQTLESVLAQDLGPDKMQIEVVDDCSTKDDPEAVVREVGKGRVAFYRKEKNEGAIPNFNTCIERSRGEFVHILHGDDYVMSGFYQLIEKLSKQHPKAALLATRVVFIDEKGKWSNISERLPDLENGSNDNSSFFLTNPLQFAGVVIRRKFYEENGAFRNTLIHTADWDMWQRAIKEGMGVVSDRAMAYYRLFGSNDTSKLMKTGQNLIDRLKIMTLMAAKDKNFPHDKSINSIAQIGYKQEIDYRNTNDKNAADANAKIWKKIAGFSIRMRIFYKFITCRIKK